MGVQAQKSGRRARKRAVVGDGLIAQLERDKDVRQLVAAETEGSHGRSSGKDCFERRTSSPRSAASSLVTSWTIGLQQKPSSHRRSSNRA